jgi:hypothetical protein
MGRLAKFCNQKQRPLLRLKVDSADIFTYHPESHKLGG